MSPTSEAIELSLRSRRHPILIAAFAFLRVMSLVERISNLNLTLSTVYKKESVDRFGQLHPSPLQYSRHQPHGVAGPCRTPPALWQPSTNQTDEELRLPISSKHSLNIAAFPVPA